MIGKQIAVLISKNLIGKEFNMKYLSRFKRKVVEKLYKVLKPYLLKDFMINEKPDYYVHKNDFSSHQIKLGDKCLVDSTSVFKTTGSYDQIIIGEKTSIGHGVCLLTYGGSIEIGENCDINPYSIICGHGKGTRIGDNVLIAPHCMIVPSNHVFKHKDLPIISQGSSSKGIVIEDDVWIGHGCSILDGVTIGKGAVISAGSVVRRDIDCYEIFMPNSDKIYRK